MKIYSLMLCLCLFAAISVMATNATAGQSTDASKQEMSKQKAQAVTGEIVSLDPTSKELVLKDSAGKELRLLASDTTQVYRDGQTITLAELKTSDKVICEVEEAGGKWMAKSIRVGSMKAGR